MLDRETPGGLSPSDKVRLVDARRAVRDADRKAERLAYEDRRSSRPNTFRSPSYRPVSQKVDIFPRDGSGPIEAESMEDARAKASEKGLIDNNYMSQAKAKQLASKYNIPVASFDRAVAKDLVDHNITADEAMRIRGVNPVTGQRSAQAQSLFDDQERRNAEDFNKFGLSELYNKRMDEQIKRENPFDTPDQLLAKRIQRQSQR